MLAIDAINKTFGCIGLRWHIEDFEEERCSASKFFGIVPVKSILGRVHLVPRDGALNLLDSKDLPKREFDRLQKGGTGWSGHIF